MVTNAAVDGPTKLQSSKTPRLQNSTTPSGHIESNMSSKEVQRIFAG